MPEISLLAAAIADLESRRGILGDAVVDAAVAALRAAPPAPAARGAQLRQVSVLFVDIVESTALLGRVAPDEAHEVVGVVLERFAALVRQAGGDVLRYTGDGLKVAFGTRRSHEDDAERAVRAGLLILQAAAEHAQVLQAQLPALRDWPFGVRVGIHTGPVLLGSGPEADHSAMGHAVHLAARMEQSAPVGRLRISEPTWSQVRGLFDCEAQPPLVVKGHDEPLRTWLVRGEARGPERAAQRGVDGVVPPMIGRDAELAALVALLERCRAGRRHGLALVLGEAGVGKTRLRREFIDRAQTDTLQARAHPSDRLQPYGLLRQLLARRLGIDDGLHAAAARRRFVDGVGPWLGGDGTVRAQRLGHLLGLDFGDVPQVAALGGRELRAQALAALGEWLHAVAGAQGLLVVLDDAHWADDASLDAVEQLLAPAPGSWPQPLLWLLLARPALLERRAAPTAGEGFERVELHLGLLPAAAGATLADALLAPVDAAPAALRDLLVGRAQGNPYYMEELLRMLIADGVIDTAASPWQVHIDRLRRVRVPETLVGVLQARLDALPADELAALQQASIIGLAFWDRALAQLDARAPLALPALERRSLVMPRGANVLVDDTEHAFAHPLLHEVTYGTVLKPARQAGHARAARWLAERVADRSGEFLSVIAQHHERAGDPALAHAYYVRAWRDARRRYANHDAVNLAERALALPAGVTPGKRFWIMLWLAELLQAMGLVERSAAQLQRAADFAEACAEDWMRAECTTARMLRADAAGRPGEARDLAATAIALVARSGSALASGAGAKAHGELAYLAMARDDFDEMQRQLDAGIRHARIFATVPIDDGGYDGYELQMRLIEIMGLLRQEKYAAGDAAIERALQAMAAMAQPSVWDRLYLMARRCEARRQLGDVEDAARLADEAVALAGLIGIPRQLAQSLCSVAEVALARGDAAGLHRAADEIERIANAHDLEYLMPQVWRQRGDQAWIEGDDAVADAAWQRASEMYLAHQREPDVLWLRCRRAALRQRAGDTAAALRAVDEVLAEIAGDGRPNRPALSPDALLACHDVLKAAGDGRAAGLLDDLALRLDEQLAGLPAAAERQRLLTQVPHWREVARLRSS